MKNVEFYNFLSECRQKFFDKLTLYENDGLIDTALIEFCQTPGNPNAKEVYKAFLNTYQVPGLEQLNETMHKFEENSSTLLSSHRDHYIHTVNVFLLGIAFYVSNHTVRQAVDAGMKYPDNYKKPKEEFLYRWGLTSLFHDVGYPIEIAFKTIFDFSSMLMIPKLDVEGGKIVAAKNVPKLEKPVITLKFPALEELLYINNIPPKETLKKRFYKKYPEFLYGQPNDLLWAISKNISQKLEFADEEAIYNKLIDVILSGPSSGILDHGIYSAIIFLKWVNAAIIKPEWNPAYFYIPVVDSATAIILHNSYSRVFRKVPFNQPPLPIAKHALAYLLILCDNLQENDRLNYGYDNKDDSKIEALDLSITDDSFRLKIDASKTKDSDTVKKMNTSIIYAVDIKPVFQSFVIE